MSRRRRKIAWRRFVHAELCKALQPIVGKPYTEETYQEARMLLTACIDRILARAPRAPVAIIVEGVTLAFFTAW